MLQVRWPVITHCDRKLVVVITFYQFPPTPLHTLSGLYLVHCPQAFGRDAGNLGFKYAHTLGLSTVCLLIVQGGRRGVDRAALETPAGKQYKQSTSHQSLAKWQ